MINFDIFGYIVTAEKNDNDDVILNTIEKDFNYPFDYVLYDFDIKLLSLTEKSSFYKNGKCFCRWYEISYDSELLFVSYDNDKTVIEQFFDFIEKLKSL